MVKGVKPGVKLEKIDLIRAGSGASGTRDGLDQVGAGSGAGRIRSGPDQVGAGSGQNLIFNF